MCASIYGMIIIFISKLILLALFLFDNSAIALFVVGFLNFYRNSFGGVHDACFFRCGIKFLIERFYRAWFSVAQVLRKNWDFNLSSSLFVFC